MRLSNYSERFMKANKITNDKLIPWLENQDLTFRSDEETSATELDTEWGIDYTFTNKSGKTIGIAARVLDYGKTDSNVPTVIIKLQHATKGFKKEFFKFKSFLKNSAVRKRLNVDELWYGGYWHINGYDKAYILCPMKVIIEAIDNGFARELIIGSNSDHPVKAFSIPVTALIKNPSTVYETLEISSKPVLRNKTKKSFEKVLTFSVS